MSSYDSWLEAPYVQAAENAEAWERFCDERGYGYDVEDESNVDEFNEWLDCSGEPDPDDARDAWLESRWED